MQHVPQGLLLRMALKFDFKFAEISPLRELEQ